MGELVRLEVADGIGTIRLDRPPVNALNDQLTGELADAARAAAVSDEVRAVIIYGGEKVFAAGADITEMAEASYAEMAIRSGQLHATMALIAGLPKPVVAAITGYALGGGRGELGGDLVVQRVDRRPVQPDGADAVRGRQSDELAHARALPVLSAGRRWSCRPAPAGR